MKFLCELLRSGLYSLPLPPKIFLCLFRSFYSVVGSQASHIYSSDLLRDLVGFGPIDPSCKLGILEPFTLYVCVCLRLEGAVPRIDQQ